MPPGQPLIDLNDDPDPVAEVGQRAAAATQTVQSALTTWAIYGQRGSTATRGNTREERTDARSNQRDAGEQGRVEDNDLVEQFDEISAAAAAPATVRPLIPAAAGLDSVGEGSVLTDEQQEAVVRRFRVVDEVGHRMAALLEPITDPDTGADEAAEAGALWAGNDDHQATVSYIGGTNPHGARTARVHDAMGDASEQVGEEAIDHDDPLAWQARLDDGNGQRDPLRINAWETLDPMTDPDQGHRR